VTGAGDWFEGFTNGLYVNSASTSASSFFDCHAGLARALGGNSNLGNTTGIVLEGGVLDLDTVSVSGNNTGIQVKGGQLNTNLVAVEFNQGSGMQVTGGVVQLVDAGVAFNDTGVVLTGGALVAYQTVVGANSSVGIDVKGGSMEFADGGVVLNGPDGGSGTTADGIRVEKTDPSGAAIILASTIADNANHGVFLTGTSGAAVGLAGNVILGNGGPGVELASTGTPGTAVIASNVIAQNASRASTHSKAGVLINGPAQLTFSGNAVFSNQGSQVDFESAGPSNAPWNISANSCSAADAPNLVACYTGTDVGIYAALNVTVNAGNVTWANYPPSPITFDYGGPGNVQVTGGACQLPSSFSCP
jgi:hypothetical protein